MASWHDVRRVVSALPQTSEKRNARGLCAWAVSEKGFAWERPLRAADLAALGDAAPRGPILGIRTLDLEMKDVLLASDPNVFFTTPHFDGYAAVLVRLEQISVTQLHKTLVEAWLARAPKRLATRFLDERTDSPPASRRRSKPPLNT